MQRKINLIPSELVVSASTNKTKSMIISLATVGVIILLLLIISAIGGIIIYSSQLKSLNTNVDRLKEQVLSLEKTEQRLVLAQDRLAKIKEIRQEDDASAELALFKEMSSQTSPEITFAEVNIESKKLESTIFADSSNPLALFFKNITNLNGAKSILLSALSFNPTSGYLASLIFESDGVKSDLDRNLQQ